MNREQHSMPRAVAALVGVLPPVADAGWESDGAGGFVVEVAGRSVRLCWAHEGWLRDVLPLLVDAARRPDVVAARRMSAGAREVLEREGIGWLDEEGNAAIATDSIVVSRLVPTRLRRNVAARWTPSVVAVTEALICGVDATVSAMSTATGLSAGSCTNALRVLKDLELISSSAARGRESARQVTDIETLIDAYAEVAKGLAPKVSVTVGVAWRDALTGLCGLGDRWDEQGVAWAATGVAAGAAIAPLLTNFETAVVYVNGKTVPDLERIAKRADLKPIKGGRLTMRPFPTVATRELATIVDGLRVAPWPRVYVDLRETGVRGEEAAEHLREVCVG